MKSLIIALCMLLNLSASYSAEFRFTDEAKKIRPLLANLTVEYFDSTDELRTSTIVEKNGVFSCELVSEEVKSVMLHHKKIYVCHLNRQPNGDWPVPFLVSIMFDLSDLRKLEDDQYLYFADNSNDYKSGFYQTMQAGEKLERIVNHGLIIGMGLFTEKKENVDSIAEDKGLLLISGKDKMIVNMSGVMEKKWSMEIITK